MRKGFPWKWVSAVLPAGERGEPDTLRLRGRRERMGNLVNQVPGEHVGVTMEGCWEINC